MSLDTQSPQPKRGITKEDAFALLFRELRDAYQNDEKALEVALKKVVSGEKEQNRDGSREHPFYLMGMGNDIHYMATAAMVLAAEKSQPVYFHFNGAILEADAATSTVRLVKLPDEARSGLIRPEDSNRLSNQTRLNFDFDLLNQS